MRKFQAFTKSKKPSDLNPSDVKDFIRFLAVQCRVSAFSQNQAINALLFLYRRVLKTDFGDQSDNVRARRTRYIPVVLSREEVDSVIGNLNYPYDLVVRLLYGYGLRLFECMNLRLHNFNLAAGILTVHDGKGKKDKTMPLPRYIILQIKNHITYVTELHQKDLNAGYAGAFVDGLLEKKYKDIGKDLIWRWFFSAKTLTLVPDEGKYSVKCIGNSLPPFLLSLIRLARFFIPDNPGIASSLYFSQWRLRNVIYKKHVSLFNARIYCRASQTRRFYE